MKFFIQIQSLISFTLCQLGDRNTCPTADNLGNLFIGNTLVNKGSTFLFGLRLFRFQFLLQLRQLAVLQLGGFIEIIITLGNLNLII